MSTRIAPVFLISLIFGCATTDGAGGVSSSEGDRPAAGSAGAGATSGGAGGGGNESGGSAGDGGSDPGGMGGGENAGAGGNGGTAPTTGGTGGQAGAAGSAGSGGSGGTPNPLAGECPIDVEGPRLVKVWSRAGGVFCIDSTEVLRDQYRKFIDDNVPVDSTGDCSWNSTYTPLQAASGQCSSGEWPNNASNFNHPVVCVDWCDAKGYCEWAGKRLCFGVAENPNDNSVDEWYDACSKAGTKLYPYGPGYEAQACNGNWDSQPGKSTVAPGTFPDCEGGWPGVWDMVGNVWEWTNACEGSGDQMECWSRGGAFYTGAAALTCTHHSAGFGLANGHWSGTGFRCCADVL